MTTELTYLLLTAILTGCLWVPVVIGYAKTRGPLKPEDYVHLPDSPLPDWVIRANRAHQNAVENVAQFAAVVLIAHVVGISTGLTALMATLYFWARLAHAVVFIAGVKVAMARTVIFSISWATFLIFALAVLFGTPEAMPAAS